MCTSPKEMSPVCGSQTQRPPTLVGIALRKPPWSFCLDPSAATAPSPFLRGLAVRGFPGESELPWFCAGPWARPDFPVALMPVILHGTKSVRSKRLSRGVTLPPLSSPFFFPFPAPPSMGLADADAVPALWDARLLLPPDPR